MSTIDKFSRTIYTEKDLCELIYSDPDINLDGAIVEKILNFDPELQLNSPPQLELIDHKDDRLSIEQWDKKNQRQWWMPKEYKNLDIAQWIIDQCPPEEHRLQRVAEELLRYQQYEMFDLLRYLKYLVDTMRTAGIVWGVGRGSSVASYVLYLIGIHKIDSVYWDIPIDEFLRD